MNTTPCLQLGNIPSGYFLVITEDGLVQVHIGLFTNTMEPCELDLSTVFPGAIKSSSENDKSFTIQAQNPLQAVLLALGGSKKKVRVKGRIGHTSIYEVL